MAFRGKVVSLTTNKIIIQKYTNVSTVFRIKSNFISFGLYDDNATKNKMEKSVNYTVLFDTPDHKI